MSYKKKLIEVALPLEDINKAAAREKSLRHGHPSTLHLWWARRPLAACRAVLFASLVDDPSAHPEKFPTEETQKAERERLFEIIRKLVVWENSTNEEVLDEARREILASTDGNPPSVLDPFCGGGSIPLEAQRLGLKAYASDLNPVAVLITKALIEIPPKFAEKPPVNPEAQKNPLQHTKGWKGAQGLAEDVRYYGKWMREEAFKKIGHLYPKVTLPKEYGGGEATVIAWLWAHTVKCPNPACGATMPLARSFVLSTKKGNEAWVEPIIEPGAKQVRFEVRTGKGKTPDPPKTGRGAKFRCIICGQDAEDSHIKEESCRGRMSAQLMAIVAEGKKGRLFLSPNESHENVGNLPEPNFVPNQPLAYEPRAMWCTLYGLDTFDKLFTHRQLIALSTFSDLVMEARKQILVDSRNSGMPDDRVPLNADGSGAEAYADAVAVYLGLSVSKAADLASAICHWQPNPQHLKIAPTYTRHALPMAWDFAEGNPFSESSGNFARQWELISKTFSPVMFPHKGSVEQHDATNEIDFQGLISTDPPYYDNIGYADLSDFFYVWLRRNLIKVYPGLFATMLVPKSEELVASPYRYAGDKKKAEKHFLEGLGKAFQNMYKQAHRGYPLTIYYAFKQSEQDEDTDGHNGTEKSARASTGWETMLEGLICAGFGIVGTWPMRTERPGRMIEMGTNALASSIVLVCRPRPDDAPSTTRREFLTLLRRELPLALQKLQEGRIAPVDFAQAAIGPGMAVYSRYSQILEADGKPMKVRTALQIINQELDQYFAELEGEYDGDTRFAIAWFETHGMNEGPFGEADVLARAKNTSVQGVVESGILQSRSGKVRILKRDELKDDWTPEGDKRITIWECTQYLIRALEKGGEEAAASLMKRIPKKSAAQSLAYRLFAIAERKKLAAEALPYNMLIASWGDVDKKASSLVETSKQGEFSFKW